MSDKPALIVSFDSAWGGTGWAICTKDQPIWSGHIKPGTWREAGLLANLRAIEHLIADERIALGGVAPRVVVERLPWHYRGRPGSQVRTVYGISGCAHVIVSWGCRDGWDYPWLQPPNEDSRRKGLKRPPKPNPGWRQWWGITGRRLACKQRAISIVRGLGWGDHLADHKDIDDAGDGPRGDVAEAILLGVGAARHVHQAPKGPRHWPAPPDLRATLPTPLLR